LINSTTYHQLDQPLVFLRDSLIDERTTSTITCGSEELRLLLGELADQQEPEARHSRTDLASPVKCYTAPLSKVDAGPYQSLGGYFDYTNWAGRDRFMELDKAISLIPCQRNSELAPDLLAA
jgi:hypothetical protein